jgi:glutamate N-acetyltransferase/amino-acid N-acetyltransferase
VSDGFFSSRWVERPEHVSELDPAGLAAGFRAAGVACGIKDGDALDLGMLVCDEAECTSDARFTPSGAQAAPVLLTRERCELGAIRAVVVNSGNANAATGRMGFENAAKMQGGAAMVARMRENHVAVCSTGVIGVPLPIDKAEAGVEAAFVAPPASWEEAAAAIGTTDTFPKAAVQRVVLGGREVSLVGIIKGSGMIMPDMATMLGFIFTDAAIAPGLLQEMLSAANPRSFSCITVDTDTSTSDTVLVLATGKAGNPPLVAWGDAGAEAFYEALTALCIELAQLVVRDGEGASKFITIEVSGAESDESARRVAMSVANSPLVKTAIAGEDANWGRVVMAIGKAGEPAERDRIGIRFGDTQVARDGLAVEGYDEEPVARHLKGKEITIGVELGLGDGRATVWTCDLTHGYISINADYRT